jgi:hypothetical protein
MTGVIVCFHTQSFNRVNRLHRYVSDEMRRYVIGKLWSYSWYESEEEKGRHLEV